MKTSIEPNENQAEKHSAEPKTQERLDWLAEELLCARCEQSVRVRDGCEFGPGDICDECIEKELDSLRAELSTLRKELEAANKAQEWVEKWNVHILTLLHGRPSGDRLLSELRDYLKTERMESE